VQVDGECPSVFLVGELISVCGQFSVVHGVLLAEDDEVNDGHE